MTIQGFTVKFSGFNYNPDRNEATAFLRAEIKSHAHGFAHEWKRMTFAEQCKSVQKQFGFDLLYINAVQGAHLGFSR